MIIRTLTLNACLDVFYRLPRLVPGEVNRAEEPATRAGGKGVNVSREVIRQGGATCAYVLLAGENGRRLSSLMQREDIHFVAEWVEGETRTNLVISTNSGSYKINSRGPNGAAEGAARLVETFVEECQDGDIAVISGSSPPGVRSGLVAEAISALRARHIPVWLDASGELLRAGLMAGPSGIKPNIDEIRELCGYCGISFDEKNPQESATSILSRFDLGEILLTLGPRGAARITLECVETESPSVVRAGHATGAGDAFLGAYLCAQARGVGGAEALREAVAAGGNAVVTTGSTEARRKTERVAEG